jgi:hypothetical protein
MEDANRFTPSGHSALASIRHIPDLLDSQAGLGVDGPLLCGALDFAFAGGGCLETLERAMDEFPLTPSDFRPESYLADLALPELVDRCMGVTLGTWKAPLNRTFVTRVLASPPSSPRVRQFRREILGELAEDANLREAFGTLYRRLCELRVCFALYEGHELPLPPAVRAPGVLCPLRGP